MKRLGLFAIGAATLLGASNADAQLVTEQVVGSERLCVYRAAPVGDATKVRTVGLGEACAANYPPPDKNRPAPPTARLASSSVVEGRRICTYEQRNRTWEFAVPVGTQCALTFGMLEAQREQNGSGSAAR